MRFGLGTKYWLMVIGLLMTSAQAEDEKLPVEAPQAFITNHSGKFNGQKIAYRATAGETYLRDLKGEPKASIFSFAYTKQKAETEAEDSSQAKVPRTAPPAAAPAPAAHRRGAGRAAQAHARAGGGERGGRKVYRWSGSSVCTDVCVTWR